MEPVQPSLGIEDRIVVALRQIIRAVDLHSRQLVDAVGLTGPQLVTLQQAARLQPVSASALARAVHVSHPTLTGILTRLERRGLVRRTRGEADRRTVHVGVTDAGRAVLERAPSLLQDRFHAELSRLEDWEQQMTLALLQRVARMMGADRLSAAPLLEIREETLPPWDEAAGERPSWEAILPAESPILPAEPR